MTLTLWYNSYIMGDLVQKKPKTETQWAAAYTWVDYMKEITPSVPLDNDPQLMLYYVHNKELRRRNNGNDYNPKQEYV